MNTVNESSQNTGPTSQSSETCESAEPNAWAKSHIEQYGYDMQAEWYSRGVAAVAGPRRQPFLFLVQEKSAPYELSVVELTESYFDVARGKIDLALARWRHGMTTGEWPGYATRVANAEPKPWELMEHEMRMAELASIGAPAQSDDDAAAELFGAVGGKDGNLLQES